MAAFAATVALVLAISLAAWNASVQRACRIDPVAVDLGPLPPAGGVWAHNFNLADVEKVVVGQGPEDLAVDSQGRVYTAVEDGWIKRIRTDGAVENHTYVGGRPLGIALGPLPEEEIYYVDPDLGLFKISSNREVHLLSNEVDDTTVLFADGLVVAKDGTVYFTDCSTKFKFKEYVLDVLEGRSNGRLLQYDPLRRKTSILLKDMAFPNGVALSEDEDFLLIAETSRARVMRYWLKGKKQGILETFIDGLPAYPDNVRLSDGNFYIGLPGMRRAFSDWLMSRPSRQLKCLLAQPALSSLLVGDNYRRATLIVVSHEGQILNKYEDPTGKAIRFVTGAMKIGDSLYLSGMGGNYLGRHRL